ncbi:MAG: TldD/PmbA family protein [Candidatus Sabulitectum sp.]|nr:TldD/PmbA family protein [Candidatus Sabulitectum sp.]
MQKHRDLAEKAVAGSEADFAELRLARTSRTTVTHAGLTHMNNGPIEQFTGTARVFIAGKWGICEFSSPEQMHKALDKAAALAIHSKSHPVPFPILPPACRDTYSDDVNGVPLADVPLREKSFLCKHYCELLGASIPSGSARVTYDEIIRDRVIANSNGTSVREIENLGSMKTQAVLPGGLIASEELALRGSFDRFTGREKHIAGIGSDLLFRETTTCIAQGKTRVILDPELTGILVHEAFGHLVEADFLENNPAVAHLLRIGSTVGSKCVNIVDDSLQMNQPGSMKWDDEGSPGRKTQLVSSGKIINWLHTIGTASRKDTRPTGNARISGPGRTPEARMTCTYMEPGKTPLEKLKLHLDDGLYLKGFMGGATDMDRFSIAVQEVWTIRNGVIHKPVTPVVISGRVADVLGCIVDTGDDLQLSGSLSGCSRRGSSAIAVTYGGPHILISEMQVS